MQHKLFPPSKDDVEPDMDVKQIDLSKPNIKDALVLLYLKVTKDGLAKTEVAFVKKLPMKLGHEKCWDLYKKINEQKVQCTFDQDNPNREKLFGLSTKYDENRNPYYQFEVRPKYLPDDELTRLMREKIFSVKKSELDSMVEKIESLKLTVSFGKKQ